MVNIVNENILKCKEDIICHQVNCQGYMGGGVARQLANCYEDLEEKYSEYCKSLENDYKYLKGKVFFYEGHDNKIICNMFSQKPNFDTDYKAMKKALDYIKLWASNNNLSIAIPYRIGCRHCKWRLEYSL